MRGLPGRIAERRRRAHLLELYLGYACNARCPFCYNGRGPAFLSFADAAQAMAEARLSGRERLDFIGGEPTLHADLVKACALAKRLGFKSIGLYTNGIRLADRGLTRDLGQAGLDTAFVAFHGHAPGTHDAITGVAGSFDLALKGLENLAEQGIQARLVCVLDSSNYDRVGRFCGRFIGMLGKPLIRIIRVFYAPHGRFSRTRGSEIRQLLVKMSQAAPHVLKAFSLFAERGLEPPTLNHFTPCVFPGHRAVRERLHCLMEEGCADGAVSYSSAGFKPIDSSGLEEIKPEKCRNCAYYAPCSGVEKSYLDIFGDGELKPLPRRSE